MCKDTTQKMIEEYMNIKWNFEDFFAAYLTAKKIDEDGLTDEEYEKLCKDCEEKINTGMLRGLRETITEDINERLVYLF